MEYYNSILIKEEQQDVNPLFFFEQIFLEHNDYTILLQLFKSLNVMAYDTKTLVVNFEFISAANI
jgi:hypothetical protein